MALALISSKVCDAAESSCSPDFTIGAVVNPRVVKLTDCLHDHCADAADQDVASFAGGLVGNCSALYALPAVAGDCSSDISVLMPGLPSGTPLHMLCGSQCSGSCLVAGGGSKMQPRMPATVSQDNNVQQNENAAQAETQEDDGHIFTTGRMMIAATVIIVFALVGVIVCFYIARHAPVKDLSSAPDKSEKVSEVNDDAGSRV